MERMDRYDYGVKLNRGQIIEVHIADLHFGAFNPQLQYQILQEQFIDKIKQLNNNLALINSNENFFRNKDNNIIKVQKN